VTDIQNNLQKLYAMTKTADIEECHRINTRNTAYLSFYAENVSSGTMQYG